MQGSRIVSLDAARGFAIFVMIEAHIATILSSSVLNNLSRVVAGPFFILISGLAFELFISSRVKRGDSRSQVFLESLSRSVVLSAITFLPYVVANLVMPSAFPWYGVLKWSVFQVISVGYVLGFFLRGRLVSKLAAVAVILLFTCLLKNSETLSYLTTGLFPLLPFLGFFVMGQVFSNLYTDGRIASVSSGKLMFLATVPVVTLIATMLLSQTAFEKETRDQAHVFLLICGLQLFTIILFILLADRARLTLALNVLEGIGRVSFSAYYLHLAMLFILGEAFAVTHFAPSNGLDILLANLTILLSATWTISFLERKWRRFKYVLGVEWMFRMGSKAATLLFRALTKRAPTT